MMTATYTDATTGWEQRVKVAGETVPELWTWIANSDGEEAYVRVDRLSDFRRAQGDNREYLPAWQPKQAL